MLRRPKVAFLPFGYPDYSRKIQLDYIAKARLELDQLGIDVLEATPVIEYNDTEKAVADIRPHDFDCAVVLIGTWVEAANVIATLKPFKHKPMIVWSLTTFEHEGWKVHMGSMAGAGVIRETLEEMDFRIDFTWGMPGSKMVRQDLRQFTNVSRAISLMDSSRILMIGYASMGMYTATFDHVSLRSQVGPEVVHEDTSALIREYQKCMDSQECRELCAEAARNWKSSVPLSEADLKGPLALYVALRNMARDFDACTVMCHYELSRRYRLTCCIPLCLLGDEKVCSCEADIPLITTQLALHYLSDGKVTSYGDVHDIGEDGKIIYGACGYAPRSLGVQGPFQVSKLGGGEGLGSTFGGLQSSTPYRQGRVTLARLSSIGSHYRMHIARGNIETPADKICELDTPPYPTGLITLDTSHVDFGKHLMSQHYALVYDDVRDDLTCFCRLLGIEVVEPGH